MAKSVIWQDLLADKKQRQLDAIPNDWIITPPSDDTLDVTGVPAACGLLNKKELDITEIIDVEVLLQKLASGELSSVEVTRAYYKRAVIAQQVVRPYLTSNLGLIQSTLPAFAYR
jgi:amidase